MRSIHPSLKILFLAILVLATGPTAVLAQGQGSGVRDAYFRAVGDHFDVSEAEVGIIGEWELRPDEVPVVLFLAGRAGVSPDALIGLRRGGRPWRDVALRLGIEARDFHLPLPQGAELGPLTRAYTEFRQRPVRDWATIRLEDQDIVTLVNLRVLSEQTGVSPVRVLAGFSEAGSFMAAYPLLLGR